jgi:hypothetical protein
LLDLATLRLVVLALQLGLAHGAHPVTIPTPVHTPQQKEWREFQSIIDRGKLPVRPWSVLNVPFTQVKTESPTLFLPLAFAKYVLSVGPFQQPVASPSLVFAEVFAFCQTKVQDALANLRTHSEPLRGVCIEFATALEKTAM